MKRSMPGTLNRRDLLAGAALLGLTRVAPARDEPSLAALGRAIGVEIGCCWSDAGFPGYAALVERHCDLIVHEWQLKPRFLKPRADAPWRFAEADAIAAAARARGKRLHGHTLYWHHEPIGWADSDDLATAKRRYGTFIRTVVERYPDFVSWDVMNEIAEEGTVLRETAMLSRHGYEFIDFCFRTAHEAAPRAKLVLNDYNLECGPAFCAAKRANMLAILRRLKAMGTPLHALGIQAHLSSRFAPAPAATADFIAEAAGLGLEVYISEIDVNDIDFADATASRDGEVAKAYERFLEAVLAQPAVRRIVFWGLSDAVNWITTWDDPGESRGALARPALFDRFNRPKPAFDAVARALRSAPGR